MLTARILDRAVVRFLVNSRIWLVKVLVRLWLRIGRICGGMDRVYVFSFLFPAEKCVMIELKLTYFFFFEQCVDSLQAGIEKNGFGEACKAFAKPLLDWPFSLLGFPDLDSCVQAVCTPY